MANQEICLYGDIYDWSATDTIQKISAADSSEALDLRINSNGGSVFSAYGIAAKIKEHGNVNMKVDGIAASSAAYLCLFGKSVECLDVSNFMFHRADMDGKPSKEDQAQIDKINGELRAKLEAKIKPEDFKKETGVSIEDIFEHEDRVEAWLNAQQALKIGLVDKMIKLSPEQAKAYHKGMTALALSLTAAKKTNKEKQTTMTLAEIKAQHPSVYNEIIALGHAAGVETERDRAGSYLAFIDVDPKAVVKGIKSDKPITATMQSDLLFKKMEKNVLAKLKKENPAHFLAKVSKNDEGDEDEEEEEEKEARTAYEECKEECKKAKKAMDDEDEEEAKAEKKEAYEEAKKAMEESEASYEEAKKAAKTKKADSGEDDEAKKGKKTDKEAKAFAAFMKEVKGYTSKKIIK
jgi:ATP-dependent protease ClpP protease subunit